MKASVLLIAALVGVGSAAAAQRPVKLNVGGGFSLPIGDFNDSQSPGWHALVGLDISNLMQPLGLRLEGAYNRFTARSTDADQTITSGTANVTYRLPMTNSPLSPYVIAGAGAYDPACRSASCVTKTKFGWNAGAGTKAAFLGAKWFVEGRFQSVNGGIVGNARFASFTLGLTL